MKQITLQKNKNHRATFMGEEVYKGSTEGYDKERESRWAIARIFIIDSGYILGMAFKTTWIKERDNYKIFTCETKEQVIDLIKNEVPELQEEVTKVLNEIKETNGKTEKATQKDGAQT